MNLEMQFDTAAKNVMNLNQKPSNTEMIKLYGMFKYVCNGNCNVTMPSRLYVKEYAKANEWLKHNDRFKDDVMNEYINYVNELILKYGINQN